jgi:acetoin utilization deacetylase AcuC-like enzyme
MASAYVTHSDCSLHDTGWAHPEHQGRLAAVSRSVYRDMLTLHEHLRELEAVPATEADLLLGHDAAYLGRVRQVVEAAERAGDVLPLDGDVRLSGASWDAARAAVGAGITAADAVLDGLVENAFCAVRPPGHQAGFSGSGGFSVFNTVAIAARHLRERRKVERVLVLEWSAAPGRGTAEILSGDRGLRFATVHQRDAGEAWGWPDNAIARPVEPGSNGGAILAASRAALDSATADFTPQFVLLSLGLDVLTGDPVGGLAAEPGDAFTLTRDLMERAASWCDGRLVSVLEGGYAAAPMGSAVVQHLRALAGLSPA